MNYKGIHGHKRQLLTIKYLTYLINFREEPLSDSFHSEVIDAIKPGQRWVEGLIRCWSCQAYASGRSSRTLFPLEGLSTSGGLSAPLVRGSMSPHTPWHRSSLATIGRITSSHNVPEKNCQVQGIDIFFILFLISLGYFSKYTTLISLLSGSNKEIMNVFENKTLKFTR